MPIYVDHAATTAVSPAALEAMLPCLTEIYGNPSSLHTPGREAEARLAEARRMIAECIHANPSEIYFTSGGSDSDNWAITQAAYLGARKGKKHLISTAF